MSTPDIEQTLENCEFFKGLKKIDIKKIAGLCRVSEYKGGEYIFQQGDFGEYLYIIVGGHVFLERSVDLDSRKGNVIIDSLGKGRVLGCWSTLLGEPHYLMSSGCCRKPTKILVLNGDDLRQLMLANTSFGLNVMERLCFLLRDRIQAAYGAMEKI